MAAGLTVSAGADAGGGIGGGVHRLVGQLVGMRVLGARNPRVGDVVEPGRQLLGPLVQRNQVGVFDAPSACHLLDHQFGVHRNGHLGGALRGGGLQSRDEAAVLGDVVGGVADRFLALRKDRSAVGREHDRAVSGGPRIAPRPAVGLDPHLHLVRSPRAAAGWHRIPGSAARRPRARPRSAASRRGRSRSGRRRTGDPAARRLRARRGHVDARRARRDRRRAMRSPRCGDWRVDALTRRSSPAPRYARRGPPSAGRRAHRSSAAARPGRSAVPRGVP